MREMVEKLDNFEDRLEAFDWSRNPQGYKTIVERFNATDALLARLLDVADQVREDLANLEELLAWETRP